MEKQQVIRTAPGLPTLLGIIFITLKLCGVIDWSWWWVLAPFWLPLTLLLLFLGFCLLMAVLTGQVPRKKR